MVEPGNNIVCTKLAQGENASAYLKHQYSLLFSSFSLATVRFGHDLINCLASGVLSFSQGTDNLREDVFGFWGFTKQVIRDIFSSCIAIQQIYLLFEIGKFSELSFLRNPYYYNRDELLLICQVKLLQEMVSTPFEMQYTYTSTDYTDTFVFRGRTIITCVGSRRYSSLLSHLVTNMNMTTQKRFFKRYRYDRTSNSFISLPYAKQQSLYNKRLYDHLSVTAYMYAR